MNDSLDIQVVRGEPTPEELAAAIAVVQAALAAAEAGQASAKKTTAKSTWHRNQGMLRQGIQAGRNQWSASLKDGLR